MLRSEIDNSYYIGITKDLKKRLEKHNNGLVYSTKNKAPWELVYSKEHVDYSEARNHEIWLKKKNHNYKDKLAG